MVNGTPRIWGVTAVRRYCVTAGGGSGAWVLMTWLSRCYQDVGGLHLGFRAVKMMKGREARREIKENNGKR